MQKKTSISHYKAIKLEYYIRTELSKIVQKMRNLVIREYRLPYESFILRYYNKRVFMHWRSIKQTAKTETLMYTAITIKCKINFKFQ